MLKLTEIQSAMGLLQLKYIDDVIKMRKIISDKYDEELQNVPGINILDTRTIENYNYSYYPIFIDDKVFGIKSG